MVRLTLGTMFASLAIGGRMPRFGCMPKPKRFVLPHQGRREIARRHRQIRLGRIHYSLLTTRGDWILYRELTPKECQ